MEFLHDDILSMRIPQPDPESGNLLIAEPLVDEGCFQRSTVLIIDHDSESGTMGLVTNRMCNLKLADIVNGIMVKEEIPVYVGGPVHTERLYYIHRYGALIPNAVEVVPGLWVGGDFSHICSLIKEGVTIEGRIRFFVGYSGWEKGQLRGELDRFGWAVGTIDDVEDIFTLKENEAWRRAVGSLGPRYRVWLNFPTDVQMN